MKIVQVYKDYEPPVFGGVEHTIRLLSRGLASEPGIQVSVLCSSNRPWTTVERLEGVDVIRAATFGRVARTPVSPTIALWIKRLKPDILHFHFPNPTGELACLAAEPRCPVVVTYHADIVRQRRLLSLYRYPLRKFFRRVDRIFVTTPFALEGNSFIAPHRDRCEVLPLGISEARLQETPESRALSSRLRKEHAGPIVLFVGRMRPYKGLPVLVDAMRSCPGTLLLVGRGEMEERVRRRVKESGIESRVVFAGDVPDSDLAGYYRAADLFVLPSIARSEAFGIAMAEAMYCGVRVVSTGLGTGTSHLNLDGITGLEAPPGDVRALSDAMRTILADPEVARRLGEEGRRRSRLFLDSEMVRRTAGIYRQLLNGGAAGGP